MDLVFVGHEYVLKCSHVFNLLGCQGSHKRGPEDIIYWKGKKTGKSIMPGIYKTERRAGISSCLKETGR